MSRVARAVSKVVTLGPAGTDAHHVARGLGTALLVESFPRAMEIAWQQDAHALICPGFVAWAAGAISDTWVNLHFRYSGRMEIVSAWPAATKPMCVAINRRRVPDIPHAESIAIHPSTAVFADRYAAGLRRTFVDAKPLAVALAAEGTVDACIGSLDVVQAAGGLEAVEVFQPQMLWCLYQRIGRVEPSPRVGDLVATTGLGG
ncbi:hypothetical protein [Streptomyces sp. MnatMP-M27]|uniref:hypothetical protein n=1 Tax=Streptomyces sp. MnatMP-M27 TaxID=1839768 RepID=UPI00210C3A2E|nr:hypothetical protein [Streptomyces sp. MnatMP-M27]